MSFKDTKTAENLMKSFAGESQAKMRYEYAAKTAKKEGYEQISNIFMETALNEKEHAKVFFRHMLKNGIEAEMITINADYPVGWTEGEGATLAQHARCRCFRHDYPVGWTEGEGATLKNLQFAAEGENEEWTELYPTFADIAEEEGFKDIATSFRIIAKVEKEHEKRFRKLYDNVKNMSVFKKEGKVFWKCLNCGYIHEGEKAPNVCPACDHPQSYFEVHIETY